MKIFEAAFWAELVDRVKESVTWLSVQVSAAWAVVWIIFSQLPAEVMTELAQLRFVHLSVVAWMGIGQAVSTYFARLKKAT